MDLAVTKREQFGRAVNGLRKQGFIPAELYGRGLQNAHLAVDAKEFKKVFKAAGESTVIALVLEGGEKRSVVVHDVERDRITGEVAHIDFYQVRMDEVMKAHVPIEFVGESPAAKEHGGFVNKVLSEIEVEALPANLPKQFTIDLVSLKELNQSIYVRDISVPVGVKILIDLETVVVTVAPPRKEEETVPVAAPDVSEVKVESEEKKAERDKEKEATAEKE